MKVLGIYDGHCASAALLVDGKIVSAVSEERFTRQKNDFCYPKRSIDSCLMQAGISPNELDSVAFVTVNAPPILARIKKYCSFTIKDSIREQNEHWKPVLVEGKKSDFFQRIQQDPRFRDLQTNYDFSQLMKDGVIHKDDIGRFREIRKATAANHLDIPEGKIHFIDHHRCHAYYAYYASPFRKNNMLVLTLDGFGDGANATISLSTEDGLVEQFRTDQANIGRIYRFMTLLLGMKLAEHEYKVMGLAPYAKEKHMQPVLDEFRKTLKVEGLEWKYDHKPRDHFFHYKEALEGQRFDNIAGGLQAYTEELVTAWVRNAMEKFNANTLVLSGGVAMNVKANGKLAKMEGLDSFFVPLSPADESNAIGAAYYEADRLLREQGGEPQSVLQPISNAYLGPDFSDNEVKQALEMHGMFDKYGVEEGPGPERLAGLLAKNYIIGRCCARMEFGARALGNRSIMANPSQWENVKKINDQIKFRDFWMPFTPSILAERADDYIQNPKGLSAPFMTIAFDGTELAKKELVAAIHPADFTVRPQALKREDNPEYYDIIKAFEKKTGIGGILNTSLNLHGKPIVCSPEDAIDLFENSELDMILIGKYLISRKGFD